MFPSKQKFKAIEPVFNLHEFFRSNSNHRQPTKYNRPKPIQSIDFSQSVLKPFVLNLKNKTGFEIADIYQVPYISELNVYDLVSIIEIFPIIPDKWKEDIHSINWNNQNEVIVYLYGVLDAIFPNGYEIHKEFENVNGTAITSVDTTDEFPLGSFDCSVVKKAKSKTIKKVLTAAIGLLYYKLDFMSLDQSRYIDAIRGDDSYIESIVNETFGINETGQDLTPKMKKSIIDSIYIQIKQSSDYFNNLKKGYDDMKAYNIISDYVFKNRTNPIVLPLMEHFINWLENIIYLCDVNFKTTFFDTFDYESESNFSDCFRLYHDENNYVARLNNEERNQSYYNYIDRSMHYKSILSKETGLFISPGRNEKLEKAVLDIISFDDTIIKKLFS